MKALYYKCYFPVFVHSQARTKTYSRKRQKKRARVILKTGCGILRSGAIKLCTALPSNLGANRLDNFSTLCEYYFNNFDAKSGLQCKFRIILEKCRNQCLQNLHAFSLLQILLKIFDVNVYVSNALFAKRKNFFDGNRENISPMQM